MMKTSIIKAASLRRLLRPAAKIAMIVSIATVLGGNVAWGQAAGTLDPTFGSGGTVTNTFGGDTITPIQAVEQPNGNIVVLSQFDFVEDVGTQIGLTRYTSAGVLDTTFGNSGSTLTAFSSITFNPFAFTLETNGDILVAGTATTTAGAVEFGLARFTSNGVLDTTFGTGGVATAVVGTRPDAPSAFMLQPNGQILMGGFEDGGGKKTPGSLSLARFNSNGALDTTFGTDGVVLTTPTILGPQAFALLSNGDYLAVGESGDAVNGTEVEFSSTGVVESTVTAGTLTASSPAQALNVFEPNGDYLVAQTVSDNDHATRTSAEVELFSETGVQVSTFTPTRFMFGGETKSGANAVAVQSNGQVVVGGIVNDASPIFGGLARLDTNGALDTTFGDAGTLTTDNTINGLLIEANGDIVAVEAVSTDGIELARYLAN